MYFVKISFLVILLSLSNLYPSFAQNNARPNQVSAKAAIQKFIPNDWILERQIEGDLNKDGLADTVLVVRSQDANLILKNDGLGRDEYDSNPRSLIVLTQNKLGDYSLLSKNDTIIPIIDNAVMDDPLDAIMLDDFNAIIIEKGVLKIRIGFWTSAGGWDTFYRIFSFRVENDVLRLIGFDHHYVHRGTGEYNRYSINYLTDKIKRVYGSLEDDDIPEIWSKIPRKERMKFDDIGNGFEFIPHGVSEQESI